MRFAAHLGRPGGGIGRLLFRISPLAKISLEQARTFLTVPNHCPNYSEHQDIPTKIGTRFENRLGNHTTFQVAAVTVHSHDRRNHFQNAMSIPKTSRRQPDLTTAPVQASPANYDAEFCDSPGAFARFGLRRSLLYQLYAEGLIDGVSLRRRGAARGKRLWSCDSIRSYLRSQMKVAK